MGVAAFEPSGPLRGTLIAPPDKSISHRAALLAAMGERNTRIGRYLDAADTRSTLDAVRALGATVEAVGSEPGALDVTITGVGLRGPEAAAPIDAGNAGTLMRLLSGWLAGQDGRSYVLDGDESIRRRPMGRIAEPLELMGATMGTAEGGLPPLRIEGGLLHGIEYLMPVASAQLKSCLLLAGLLAEGPTRVLEPAPTRDHTERMLLAAGAELTTERRAGLPNQPAPMAVTVQGAEKISFPPMRVPGDLSSAAFHLAAALIVPGSLVRVEGVGLNPTRVGFLGILNRMGARLVVEESGHEAGEPVGAITARHGALKGVRVGAAEVPLAIDELPLLGLLGCFAEGDTVLTGAQELRHKESDRIAAVVDGLRGLGADIEALEDGFAVHGTGGLRGGVIGSLGDHRLAMLGAIAGLASGSGVSVDGVEAAAVSYPGFAADLSSLLP